MAAYKPLLLTPLPIASHIPSGQPLYVVPSRKQRIEAMNRQDNDVSFAIVDETAHKLDSKKTASISSVALQLDDLGLVAPTDEEMTTLRHVPDKINWTAYSEPSSVSRVPKPLVCI